MTDYYFTAGVVCAIACGISGLAIVSTGGYRYPLISAMQLLFAPLLLVLFVGFIVILSPHLFYDVLRRGLRTAIQAVNNGD